MVGDYGKPRPALVIQSDDVLGLGSVVVLPVTSHLILMAPFRIDVSPNSATGLRKPSQIMVDKVAALPVEKIASRIGSIDAETLDRVDVALARLLGLA